MEDAFHPNDASWLNPVERFFAHPTEKAFPRRSFTRVKDAGEQDRPLHLPLKPIVPPVRMDRPGGFQPGKNFNDYAGKLIG
ncbi:hypothetical protein JOD69_004195 [Methylocaldum sp. RMAD-M]|jgi:hypothetical protein|nr:hypothetical protein [Methylocaldum sp. RMAD-M]